LGAGWPNVPIVLVAPKAGVAVEPNAGAGAPKSPPDCWGAAAPKGFACPKSPLEVVAGCPNPKLLDVVVVAPNPAGLLPNRPVLPAVDVAPKADVVVLKFVKKKLFFCKVEIKLKKGRLRLLMNEQKLTN
jgi:hypothetical protein